MKTENRKQKIENRKPLNKARDRRKVESTFEAFESKKVKQTDKKKTGKIDYNELEAKYMRALADYQNLLKRTTTEKQEFAKYANEGWVREILPVYDNLQMSLKHVDAEAEENGWAEGIKYVVKQFAEILKNMGVEEIVAKGKKFDPNTMEAIDGKGEKVSKVVRPGYKLKDKVIIPAKVILKN